MPANQNVVNHMALIRQKALKYGIDPVTFAGLVDFESGGNPKAKNKSSGATGLGQVMPREAGNMFRDRPTSAELEDPEVNLEWAAKIFAAGLKRYGSEDKALAAYLGSIDAKGNITGAKDANGTDGASYIKNVRARAQSYGGAVTESGRAPSQRAVTASVSSRQAAAQAARFNGTYVMPVDGTVTNPFGGKQAYSAGKTTNIGNINNGTDIATAAGTEVRAPVGGVVVKVYSTAHDDRKGERDAEENGGWGGSIVIRGDDGKTHRLSHAQFGSILVKQGQRIEQGQITHKVGMSGNATGPHVDWEEVDEKGNHVDPLKAPAVRASEAKKILASQGVPDRADQGAGNVSQSAGNPAQAQVDEFTRQREDIQSRIKGTEQQLVSARYKLDAANAMPAGEGKNGAIGQANATISALTTQMTDLREIDREVGANLAKAKTVSSGKVIDPDEREQMQAQTEQIRAQTAALQQKLDSGGLTPLEEANIRSQIQDRNSIIRGRDAMLGVQVRGANAQAAGQEWDVAEGQATLPYRIDYTLSQTDVNDAQAQRIRETLPLELDKLRQDIDRINQLTPVEIEQGRANVDLTRQRAEETRRMLQPTIDRIASQNKVDAANVARIIQTLPLELAQQSADTQLTKANVGLTEANTARVGAETQLTKLQGAAEAERQRRWAAIEQQIRDNPGLSAQKINELVLGAASGLQEWTAAYRTQLDTQVAQQNSVFQTQQNQISQQNADVGQWSAAQQADIGQQNARTNQVNALTNTAAPSGPTRRMARMQAAGMLGGTAGIEEQARGGRVGASEMNAAKAGYEQFKSMLDGIRSSAGTVRRAPDVQAPAPISIGFTPPTVGMGSNAGTSPIAAPSPSAPSPVSALAPPSNPFAFSPPVVSEEELQRQRANSLRVSSGRGGV